MAGKGTKRQGLAGFVRAPEVSDSCVVSVVSQLREKTAEEVTVFSS